MSASNPVIAIVDDEEDVRRALSRVLAALGYTAIGVPTGEALFAELGRRPIDCVLLDLNMPGMSGFDVLEALGLLADAPPAIVITGHHDTEFTARALLLGAFECHAKPIGAQVLVAAIERARAHGPSVAR